MSSRRARSGRADARKTSRAAKASQSPTTAQATPAPQPVLPVAPVGPLLSPAERRRGRDLAWGFFLGYLLLMSAGFAALRAPGTMVRGNELNVDRAVFTSVNAATLTGFQLNVGQGQFHADSALGPVTLLLLTLGGAVFSLCTGGLAAVRVLRLPYSDGQVVSAAVTATAVSTLLGAAALLGGDRRLLDALLQSASAFANSGVYTGRLGGPGSWETHFVLMPLALVGGLGLPVLMELYDLLARRRPLSTHSRTVLLLAAGLYLAGFLLLLGSRGSFWSNLLAGLEQHGWYARQSMALRAAIASSSELSINSRSAGFPFEYAGALPRVTQWILIGLMAVGANPAGTGGGVKGTTLIQLGRGVRAALAGRPVGRAAGIAAVWLFAYLLIVLFGFLCLLWQAPELPADRLLFLSVSAASNAGLSHDAISIVLSGLFTLSLMMLLGRVVPLLVLWWMAETTADADLAVG